MLINEKYKKIIIVISLFIVMAASIYLIQKYFTPFIMIIVLLIITQPLYNLIKRFNVNNRIASLIAISILNIVLGLFLYYIGASIFELLEGLYKNNIILIDKVINELTTFLESIIGEINISQKVMNGIDFNIVKDSVILTGDGLLSYVVANITTFFILADKKYFVHFFKMIIPKKIVNKAIKEKNNIKSIIYIQIILILMSTLITLIGFLLLKIPNSIILSVICGILDLIPYIGTIIVFIPIIIYNIIVKEYVIVIGLIFLYCLVQITREILEAKLLSNKFNLHPLVVFISVYIGIKVFGVLGAFVGPIYCMISRDILINE